MNVVMIDGKKSVAEKIVYGALEDIAASGQNPLDIFNEAIENCKPTLEVKSRRVGGATYQVPVDVREDRRIALALRWIVSYSRKRPGRTMREKLALELKDAAASRGQAFKKKEDTHRMAEANKAFAHYRW
jgi:small subunit ribosomal protein S7